MFVPSLSWQNDAFLALNGRADTQETTHGG
eukprot:COSAG06_NODE_52081_length_308_cov_0.645933_2_plen_29_part_01